MLGKILIVDDDVALTKNIERILVDSDYNTILAHTAEDGLLKARSLQPDLVLLDVMVPAMGGWEACHRLREFTDIPIIFLTALGNVEDIVYGLEMGADDYMVKPFKPPEILARIKAHLRRSQDMLKSTQRYEFDGGRFVVDLLAHTVRIDDWMIDLTPREFDLLATLVNHAGRVIRTPDLVEKAWGLNDESALDNIKPYIHYLRKKIEIDPASPRWILTVRGVGYRFSDE